MVWDGVEYIVRFTRLPEELKPVEIYPADTLEPIRPDWIAPSKQVLQASHKLTNQVDPHESPCSFTEIDNAVLDR